MTNSTKPDDTILSIFGGLAALAILIAVALGLAYMNDADRFGKIYNTVTIDAEDWKGDLGDSMRADGWELHAYKGEKIIARRKNINSQ